MQADTDRGRFFPDASWGFDVSGAATSTLLGFLAPPTPAAFTLDVDVRLDAGPDGAGCATVLLSTDDSPYLPSSGASPGVDGYLVSLRADGGLEVTRVADGAATTPASSTAGAALPAGAYVPLRITVTGSDVTARAGTTREFVTVPHAVRRPVPVVHLGSVAAGVRFRNLVLT
jgi:glycerophosphoryl diester phosphodiesterase